MEQKNSFQLLLEASIEIFLLKERFHCDKDFIFLEGSLQVDEQWKSHGIPMSKRIQKYIGYNFFNASMQVANFSFEAKFQDTQNFKLKEEVSLL